MAPFGPFEAAPTLAVAVSGGADSLALTLLARDWAAERGGSLLALTVDHGLRAESAAEARRVGRILAPLGIAHRILTWRGPRPVANLQASARDLRYRLLLGQVSRRGILHLLLAHHLEDQAETLLLRLGRGSGLAGLAAMAGSTPLPQARLLRPLLPVPKARLEATLRARGLDWIEDPSNRDPAHARVRLRRLMPALAEEGLTAERLATAAGHLERARAALESAGAALLAEAARIDPGGFIELESRLLLEAEPEVGLRALAQALTAVGGGRHTPRWERLQGLFRRIGAAEFRGATLAGCRILRGGERLLILREAAAVETVMMEPGARVHWDGRFEVALRPGLTGGPFRLAGLDRAAWAALTEALPQTARRSLPAAARAGLPALFDRAGLRALPYLGYEREHHGQRAVRSCFFSPSSALSSSGFTVA